MIDFFFKNLPMCLDASPTFLGVFDMSIAPPLLFYSYMPTFALTSIFGLLIYRQNRGSLIHKLFFSIMMSFSAWIVLILMQWTAVHINIVHFSWQILIIFEFLIYLLSVYFSYVLMYKKDMPSWLKNIFLTLVLIICILIPTQLNVSYFNLADCEGVVGELWNIEYVLEAISALIIFVFIYDAKRKFKYKLNSTEIMVPVGIALFLIIFFLSNLFGEITKIYNINLIGPLGIIFLLSLMSYAIIKYKTLQLKLFGSQVLVITQWLFISALFFVQNIHYLQIIVGITLFITIPLGYFVITSVKREIEQREKIEILAKDLEGANNKLKELDQMKSEFLSLASHQMRAPLTAMKGYASMLIEGEFGTLPPKAEESVGVIMRSTQNMINTVNDFLNISRIEQGRMVYEKTDFDLLDLLKEVVEERKINIEKAALSLKVEVPNGIKPIINADRDKVRQIIGNILDNSVKYTVSGGITISLTSDQSNTMIKIKDTGIGIDPSEIGKLFNKFSRSKSANKTNVIGTGLGLYIAKKMAEDQGGNIKVFSEGEGKGSTFTIEFPKAKV